MHGDIKLCASLEHKSIQTFESKKSNMLLLLNQSQFIIMYSLQAMELFFVLLNLICYILKLPF